MFVTKLISNSGNTFINELKSLSDRTKSQGYIIEQDRVRKSKIAQKLNEEHYKSPSFAVIHDFFIIARHTYDYLYKLEITPEDRSKIIQMIPKDKADEYKFVYNQKITEKEAHKLLHLIFEKNVEKYEFLKNTEITDKNKIKLLNLFSKIEPLLFFREDITPDTIKDYIEFAYPYYSKERERTADIWRELLLQEMDSSSMNSDAKALYKSKLDSLDSITTLLKPQNQAKKRGDFIPLSKIFSYPEYKATTHIYREDIEYVSKLLIAERFVHHDVYTTDLKFYAETDRSGQKNTKNNNYKKRKGRGEEEDEAQQDSGESTASAKEMDLNYVTFDYTGLSNLTMNLKGKFGCNMEKDLLGSVIKQMKKESFIPKYKFIKKVNMSSEALLEEIMSSLEFNNDNKSESIVFESGNTSGRMHISIWALYNVKQLADINKNVHRYVKLDMSQKRMQLLNLFNTKSETFTFGKRKMPVDVSRATPENPTPIDLSKATEAVLHNMYIRLQMPLDKVFTYGYLDAKMYLDENEYCCMFKTLHPYYDITEADLASIRPPSISQSQLHNMKLKAEPEEETFCQEILEQLEGCDNLHCQLYDSISILTDKYQDHLHNPYQQTIPNYNQQSDQIRERVFDLPNSAPTPRRMDMRDDSDVSSNATDDVIPMAHSSIRNSSKRPRSVFEDDDDNALGFGDAHIEAEELLAELLSKTVVSREEEEEEEESETSHDADYIMASRGAQKKVPITESSEQQKDSSSKEKATKRLKRKSATASKLSFDAGLGDDEEAQVQVDNTPQEPPKKKRGEDKTKAKKKISKQVLAFLDIDVEVEGKKKTKDESEEEKDDDSDSSSTSSDSDSSDNREEEKEEKESENITIESSPKDSPMEPEKLVIDMPMPHSSDFEIEEDKMQKQVEQNLEIINYDKMRRAQKE